MQIALFLFPFALILLYAVIVVLSLPLYVKPGPILWPLRYHRTLGLFRERVERRSERR